MRRVAIVAAILAAPAILLIRRKRVDAPAEEPPSVPRVAVGVWAGQSMIPPRDSVIATYTLTVTPDLVGIRMRLPGREPQSPRVIAAGGDSLVTETGPYDSVARPGLKVTTRTISHFRGDSLAGTFEARYSDGSVTRGRTSGVRERR
jgi:hypothetical protein